MHSFIPNIIKHKIGLLNLAPNLATSRAHAVSWTKDVQFIMLQRRLEYGWSRLQKDQAVAHAPQRVQGWP